MSEWCRNDENFVICQFRGKYLCTNNQENHETIISDIQEGRFTNKVKSVQDVYQIAVNVI